MSNAVQAACIRSPSEHATVFTDDATTFICTTTRSWARAEQSTGAAHSWPQLGNLERKSVGGAGRAAVTVAGHPQARLQMLGKAQHHQLDLL